MLGAILSLLVYGLVIGLLARFAVPGKDPLKLWQTILLGIAGSLLGGVVAGLFGVLDGDDTIDRRRSDHVVPVRARRRDRAADPLPQVRPEAPDHRAFLAAYRLVSVSVRAFETLPARSRATSTIA